jgi:hypothetical protein
LIVVNLISRQAHQRLNIKIFHEELLSDLVELLVAHVTRLLISAFAIKAESS